MGVIIILAVLGIQDSFFITSLSVYSEEANVHWKWKIYVSI